VISSVSVGQKTSFSGTMGSPYTNHDDGDRAHLQNVVGFILNIDMAYHQAHNSPQSTETYAEVVFCNCI